MSGVIDLGSNTGVTATGGTGGGGSSQWITSGSNIYYPVGNVGIDTTNPLVPLQVNDSLQLVSPNRAQVTSQAESINFITTSSASGTKSAVSIVHQIAPTGNMASNIQMDALDVDQFVVDSNTFNIGVLNGTFFSSYGGGSGNIGGQVALNAFAKYNGTALASSVVGFSGQGQNASTGTVSLMTGLLFICNNIGGGVCTLANGVDARVNGGSNGGTIVQGKVLRSLVSIGSGSTIISGYGLYLETSGTGVGAISSSFGIYQADTRNNYFAGNIGIAKSNPAVPLDVNGILSATSVGIRTAAPADSLEVSGGIRVTGTSSYVAGAARLYFDPALGLVISAGTGTVSDLYLSNNAGTQTIAIPGGTNNLVLTNPGGAGQVGISVIGSMTAQLHTTGSLRFANFGAGAATFDANGNISSVSDGDLKDIQRDFSDAVEAIKILTPVVYKWKDISGLDTENEYIGFIAQNLEEAIPGAVFKKKIWADRHGRKLKDVLVDDLGLSVDDHNAQIQAENNRKKAEIAAKNVKALSDFDLKRQDVARKNSEIQARNAQAMHDPSIPQDKLVLEELIPGPISSSLLSEPVPEPLLPSGSVQKDLRSISDRAVLAALVNSIKSIDERLRALEKS